MVDKNEENNMKRNSILTLIVLVILTLQTAYADNIYQATVKKGDIELLLDGQPKEYKKGKSFKLKPGSLLCYHAGKGKVEVIGKNLETVLSRKTSKDCLLIPKNKCLKKEKCKPTYLETMLKTAEKWTTNGGTTSIAGAARNGGASKKITVTNIKKNHTTVKHLKLEGEDYVYIENDKWSANQYSLPITLEVIGGNNQKYTSTSMGITRFLIPWAEIEDKSNPTQSYHLKVMNNKKDRENKSYIKIDSFRLIKQGNSLK